MMEQADKVFLGKLQLLVDTFNEVDEIANNNPTNQANVDLEISDYLHLLQNESLSDKKTLELAEKLKEARQKRANYNNLYELISVYYQNNKSLLFSDYRGKFVKAIKQRVEQLNSDYKYRVLNNQEIEHFKEPDVVEVKPKKTYHSKYNITKEELESMIASGMKRKEIAKKIGCNESYIVVLKRKLGVKIRDYKKKEDSCE